VDLNYDKRLLTLFRPVELDIDLTVLTFDLRSRVWILEGHVQGL
jgi:hypothetical protein